MNDMPYALKIHTRDEIKDMIYQLMLDNTDKATQAQTNPKYIGWFVGQIMKQTNGGTNPKQVNDIVVEMILER